MVKRNNRTFSKWKSRGKPLHGKPKVQRVQMETNFAIEEAKQKYTDDLSEKLTNPKSSNNVFWSAFKRLLNSKKLANIPPLFEGNAFITNFQEKANIFNDFFATQCRPLENGSELPALVYKTNKLLSNVEFSHDAIGMIISKLNVHKAHGVDNISIAMLKICTNEVAIPLKIIFDPCISEGKCNEAFGRNRSKT